MEGPGQAQLIRESLPGRQAQVTPCVLYFTSGQRPRGQRSPGRTRKKQLCVVRGPQLRSWLSLPAPSVCSLGAAGHRAQEFQQSSLWGPCQEFASLMPKGLLTFLGFAGGCGRKFLYAETPPPHPFLLCLCVFVQDSHNRSKKGSYSLFKGELVFCWGKDATAWAKVRGFDHCEALFLENHSFS